MTLNKCRENLCKCERMCDAFVCPNNLLFLVFWGYLCIVMCLFIYICINTINHKQRKKIVTNSSTPNIFFSGKWHSTQQDHSFLCSITCHITAGVFFSGEFLHIGNIMAKFSPILVVLLSPFITLLLYRLS